MQGRIKELFGQALDQAVPGTWTTLSPLDLERFTEAFAKLVVQECINEVEGLQVSDWNEKWNQAVAHAVLQLKDHFGVEE